MDVEAEIRDLKRRVGELEGSFGFPTQQLRGVHRDLLGFQEQTDQHLEKIDGHLDRIDAKFDVIDGRLGKADARMDRVEDRLDGVEREVRQLREELPSIVGDVMREVLREQRG